MNKSTLFLEDWPAKRWESFSKAASKNWRAENLQKPGIFQLLLPNLTWGSCSGFTFAPRLWLVISNSIRTWGDPCLQFRVTCQKSWTCVFGRPVMTAGSISPPYSLFLYSLRQACRMERHTSLKGFWRPRMVEPSPRLSKRNSNSKNKEVSKIPTYF